MSLIEDLDSALVAMKDAGVNEIHIDCVYLQTNPLFIVEVTGSLGTAKAGGRNIEVVAMSVAKSYLSLK